MGEDKARAILESHFGKFCSMRVKGKQSESWTLLVFDAHSPTHRDMVERLLTEQTVDSGYEDAGLNPDQLVPFGVTFADDPPSEPDMDLYETLSEQVSDVLFYDRTSLQVYFCSGGTFIPSWSETYAEHKPTLLSSIKFERQS